jgi:hypothetical protein
MCFRLENGGKPTDDRVCCAPRQMATNAFCSDDAKCRSHSRTLVSLSLSLALTCWAARSFTHVAAVVAAVPGYVCARPEAEEHHAVIKLTLHDSSFLLFYGHPHSLWYSCTYTVTPPPPPPPPRMPADRSLTRCCASRA